MKRNLCCVALLMLSSIFISHSQEDAKIKKYLGQIKTKSKVSKLSKNLESFSKGEKPGISEKWITNGELILVDAVAKGDVSLLEQELKFAGVQDLKTHGKVVSGWVNPSDLSKLEMCTHLREVLPEFQPTRNVGSVTSEAVTTMFTAEASKIFGVNGEGVKIGILSDSFNTLGGMEAGIASGDLPGPGNPNGYTTPIEILSEIINGPGIDEGRGMAELVHDIAPGAEIAFYSAFNGFFDFADGIRALRAAGCDVIVDDIGYFASPYFQDGAIAQAVDEVVADGAVYFSSAGNSSLDSYEDEYKEVNVDGLAFYDFGGGDITQSLLVEPGDDIYLWFQWDDPSVFAYSEDPFTGEAVSGPLPDTDLDVLLFDSATGDLLDYSIFFNPVDGYPIEIIFYTNETDEAVTVDLMVQHFSGPAPRRLKYIDNGSGLNFVEDFEGNGASTCYGHSNSAGAVAVGAQAFVFSDEFRDDPYGGTSAGSLNGFSSFGGLEIMIDKDGNDIEPVDRQKPDLVATDGNSTTFFGGDFDGDGFPNFFGTSAAAPNAAAVAALMLQLKPDLTPQEIWTIMDETALDMDNPLTEGFDVGYDPATGRGFVQADKALAALQEEPTVYRYQAYDATSDEFISTLVDGSSIYLDEVEGGLINVVALATDGLEDAESVRFTLSGTDNRTVQENTAPFALFGDDGQGDFRNWEVNVGDYELSTIAFDQLNTMGSSGNTYTIGFDVDYLTTISSFILVDADTNTDIGPLEETMDISIFETYPNVTIRAEVSSALVEEATPAKVKFNLTGALQRYNEDIAAPYSLFGDNNGDFQSWQPSPVVGSYTIEATPYARVNGEGVEGISSSFSFEIVDGSLDAIADNIFESEVSLDASTKTITVSTEREEAITYSVFNSQGAIIYTSKASANEPSSFNLSKFGVGLFVVKSETEEFLNSKIYIQ